MSFQEQIMYKDMYPSIFSRQMEPIVFIILHIFFATRAVFGSIIDAKICSDICPGTSSFREANSFRERSSRKTLIFEICFPHRDMQYLICNTALYLYVSKFFLCFIYYCINLELFAIHNAVAK